MVTLSSLIIMLLLFMFFFLCFFFFFHDTATTELYTLSLHDALPIWTSCLAGVADFSASPFSSFHATDFSCGLLIAGEIDRKSTRLNSSHLGISYAVFCLKKKIINILII